MRQWRERKSPIFETVAKGDSNPGSIDCESDVLPLSSTYTDLEPTTFFLLGIIINNNFKWNSHINKIANNKGRTTYIIIRLKNVWYRHIAKNVKLFDITAIM